METLTLNDGTVVENAITIKAYIGLWIHLMTGYSFSEAYSMFSDPEKTIKIVSDKTEPHTPTQPTVYDGFTDLFSIRREDDGEIVIGLQEVDQ